MIINKNLMIIKFRQPLLTGGFHYWGFVNKGAFICPIGENFTRGGSQQFTNCYDQHKKEIYDGDYLDDDGMILEVFYFHGSFFSSSCM